MPDTGEIKGKGTQYATKGRIDMRINIHYTTPSSLESSRIKWGYIGIFVLIYSFYAVMSYCVIVYADRVLLGLVIALIPFAFLLWLLWHERNLSNSFVEVLDDRVVVTEYPFGKKAVRTVLISDVDHARLLIPSSMKLHGPRNRSVGIPYVVFYNGGGKQLFKLIASPEAIKFQESITHLIEE